MAFNAEQFLECLSYIGISRKLVEDIMDRKLLWMSLAQTWL